MEVKFSVEDSELPYMATYIGYTTPARVPVLGVGGATGRKCESYGSLLDNVIKDLAGYTGKIEVSFSEGFNEQLKEATTAVIGLIEERNDLESRISAVKKAVGR